MPKEKYLISYSYSHLHSSSGKRLRILNRYFLSQNGWRILTSCISNIDENNVKQIPTFIDKSFKPISYNNNETRRGLKQIFSKILWPDKGIFWSLKAINELLQIVSKSSNNFVLVTVSYPFSTHLVGAVLKCFFRKRITLTAHYIDLFYLINKGNGAPKYLAPLSLLADKFVLRMADKIIINISKKEEFEYQFNQFVPKCIFIDELPGIYLQSIESTALNQGTCLFAGSLYKKIRNPQKVLELFEKLPDLKLRLAGNLNDCVDVLDNKHVTYLGLLNEQAIIQELKSSDILINIDNQDTQQQPPGKIVEYMQLQKPIINFYMHTSISGNTLKRFAVEDDAFLEIDLMEDPNLNLEKLRGFKPGKKKLFEVPDNFERIYRLYEDLE